MDETEVAGVRILGAIERHGNRRLTLQPSIGLFPSGLFEYRQHPLQHLIDRAEFFG